MAANNSIRGPGELFLGDRVLIMSESQWAGCIGRYVAEAKDTDWCMVLLEAVHPLYCKKHRLAKKSLMFLAEDEPGRIDYDVRNQIDAQQEWVSMAMGMTTHVAARYDHTARCNVSNFPGARPKNTEPCPIVPNLTPEQLQAALQDPRFPRNRVLRSYSEVKATLMGRGYAGKAPDLRVVMKNRRRQERPAPRAEPPALRSALRRTTPATARANREEPEHILLLPLNQGKVQVREDNNRTFVFQHQDRAQVQEERDPASGHELFDDTDEEESDDETRHYPHYMPADRVTAMEQDSKTDDNWDDDDDEDLLKPRQAVKTETRSKSYKDYEPSADYDFDDDEEPAQETKTVVEPEEGEHPNLPDFFRDPEYMEAIETIAKRAKHFHLQGNQVGNGAIEGEIKKRLNSLNRGE
jgi:hypothetical protein